MVQWERGGVNKGQWREEKERRRWDWGREGGSRSSPVESWKIEFLVCFVF